MNRTFGLRSALILLVLIAIVPVFAVVIQASLSEQRGRLERNEAGLRSLIDLSAAHQEQFIEGARQMLTAVAMSPPVYEDDLAACTRYFGVLQDKYPRYANFGLLDVQGNLICRSALGRAPVVAGDRPYFKRAVASGGFVVGEYLVGRATGLPSLVFAMPVYRADRALRGVLFVALDLQRMGEQLRKFQIAQDVTLLVTDTNAVVLASVGSYALPVGSPVSDPVLRESILAGRARFDSSSRKDGGGDWLYAVRPVGSRSEGEVFVAAFVSQASVVAPVTRRLHLQLAALVLISLLAAVAAWVFGDRVLVRPIGQLLRRVRALQDEPVPLEATADGGLVRELAQLEQGLDDVARGLSERSVLRDAAIAERSGQKNLIESVLESMAEGVLVVDTQGRFLHMNSAATRILPGLHELNRLSMPLAVDAVQWGLAHLDGTTPLEPSERPAARALRGENVEGFRYRARGALAGGVEKVMHASARPLFGPDGRAAGAVTVFSDVTDAWRAEHALRDSEQRYRTLFESNPHPMWVYDSQTLRFLAVNDAAVGHYGYSRDDFLAMTIRDIRPEEDLPRLEQVLEGRIGEPAAPGWWRHRTRDGRLISVEVSSHPMQFGNRPARIVLAHDITLRLQAQDALAQMNDTLERRVSERTSELAIANKELESFSYSVSHDLRAPLQVIDGFGKALLSKYSADLPPQAIHYLHRIRDNTHQMSQLIDDLLSLAKVTRAEIHAESCNLSTRAGQIVERLRLRFPDRAVRLELDEDMQAICDIRLLGVVLENLIENAWKFTARTQDACVRIGCEAQVDGQRVFFVADNGAGFEMSYVDKLFKAFQRLHAPSEFEGTGIGLATVHRIITRHGGRVWAEGSPGQGAIFKFTLKGVHDAQ